MKLIAFAPAVALGACVLAAGCAHLQSGSVPTTPTPAPTASAVACNTTPNAGAQIIAISPLVTATADPTYGVIAGYGLVSSGNSNNVAAPIALASTSAVQFFNNDDTTSQLRYSAVGIPNVTAFPGPAYTFPPSASAPAGTQISRSVVWSTGLLAGQCYSQVFTISGTGVFYFGDYTYYALANLRGVIVVPSTSSSTTAIR